MVGRAVAGIATPADRPLGTSDVVVEVAGPLREEKDLLVCPRRPVADAFGHRVFLRPDGLPSQPPAVGSEGERDHPRNADKILVLQAERRWVVDAIAIRLAAAA